MLQQYMGAGVVSPALLSNAVPPGPVPLTNLAVLNSEIMTDGGNVDFPHGAGSVPNLAMTVGGYLVFGDIDRMYVQCAPSASCVDPATARFDIYYRITCVSQNVATGITSQVGALYVCHLAGNFCQPKPY